MLELMSVPEAAEFLGITEPAIRQAIQESRILGTKIKGRYYAVKEAVHNYKPREYRRVAEEMESLRRRIEQIKNDLGSEFAEINFLMQKLLISSGVSKNHDPTGHCYRLGLKEGEWDISRGFPECTFRIEDYETYTDEVIEQHIQDWIQEVQQGGFLVECKALKR